MNRFLLAVENISILSSAQYQVLMVSVKGGPISSVITRVEKQLRMLKGSGLVVSNADLTQNCWPMWREPEFSGCADSNINWNNKAVYCYSVCLILRRSWWRCVWEVRLLPNSCSRLTSSTSRPWPPHLTSTPTTFLCCSLSPRCTHL